MASWTDKTPTFNPYIQQLPVEAMVEVGVQKQKQYEEGVQKIQTSIDNIAGLDVVRDVDRAYLQSKINKLGNDLRYVAAGDFSNFQLVNSVSGMTNQIVKDPNVQNAVSSAAKYRKEIGVMEEEKKKGTLTPDNKYVFDKQANAWLNDSTIGKSFNTSYTPYFDVFKFTKETFDAVKPDGYSYDQIFETDAAGNPRVDQNGNPILSPVMTRLEKEGIFPDKVKETLAQVFSDPRVNQQLNISGQYNYRGYDSKTLEEKISVQRENEMGAYADKLMDLNLKKSMGEDVDDQIDALKSQINKSSNSYDELAQLSYDNPDGVKGLLYTNDVSSRYTTMFGWSKTKQQYLDNPKWRAEFDMQKEANAQYRWKQEQDYKRERDKITDTQWQKTYEQKDREIDAKNKKGKPGYGQPTGPAGAPPTLDNELSEIDPFSTYDNLMDTSYQDYANSSNSFIWNTSLSKMPGMQEDISRLVRSGMTREEAIDVAMVNGAKKQNMSVDAFRATWLNKATLDYNKLSNAEREKHPDIANAYYNYKNSQKAYKASLKIDKDLQDLSNQKFKEVADAINTSNIKPQKITFKDVTYDMTRQDMYDLAIVAKGGSSVWQTITLDSDRKALDNQMKAARNRLIKKGKGELIDAYEIDSSDKARVTGTTSAPVIPTLSGLKKIYNAVRYSSERTGGSRDWQNVNKILTMITSDVYEKSVKEKGEMINRALGVRPNLKIKIASGDTESDRFVFDDIKRFAGAYSEIGNLSPDFDNFDTALGENMEKSTLEAHTIKNELGEPLVEIVAYKKGKRAGGMTITPDEAVSLNIDVNNLYEPREVALTRTVINSSPINATSEGDPREKSTYVQGDSYYDSSGGDFPNLVNSKYSAQGNIFFSDGQYYPCVYVKGDRGEEKVRILPGLTDLQTAVLTLKTVDPTLAYNILIEK